MSSTTPVLALALVWAVSGGPGSAAEGRGEVAAGEPASEPEAGRPVSGTDNGGSVEESGPFFYHGQDYGSESQFNPLTSFVNSSFDTLQVPRSFDDENLRGRFNEVLRHLRHPRRAIDAGGGFRDFVNRQIFPVDFSKPEDSAEMIPNYALHLVGGGMVWRKNAEWLEARGYPYPRTTATILVMSAELLQEAVEKKSTPADDEVADVFLFRPAGIVAFASNRVARFAARRLGLAEWPYQPMVDPERSVLTNAGESFILRPRLNGRGRHRPFVYYGLTTLAGASHAVPDGTRISWGLGQAVVRAARGQVQLRSSGGLFYDREDSLLASLIVNGTDELAVRLNVYPGVIPGGRWSPGVFVGLEDGGGVRVGISLRASPVGLASSF